MVRILYAIGGDCKCFQAHVDTGYRPGRGQRHYFYIGATEGNEVFPAWILADSSGQVTPLDIFGDTSLYKAEFWELHRLVQHLDIRPHALALIAFLAMVLALEFWIAGFLALFHTPEEVLICRV